MCLLHYLYTYIYTLNWNKNIKHWKKNKQICLNETKQSKKKSKTNRTKKIVIDVMCNDIFKSKFYATPMPRSHAPFSNRKEVSSLSPSKTKPFPRRIQRIPVPPPPSELHHLHPRCGFWMPDTPSQMGDHRSWAPSDGLVAVWSRHNRKTRKNIMKSNQTKQK